MSETEDCREALAKFCRGNGCDLGFGGYNPIVPTAICVDREPGHPHRVSIPDPWPTHLVWDIFTKLPFKDVSMDYIFSSHALEDADDTRGVLAEWLRVIKPGGHLVLFLPDEQAYQAHCASLNAIPNQAHKRPDFSLNYVKARLPFGFRSVLEQWPFPGNAYSFALVVRK